MSPPASYRPSAKLAVLIAAAGVSGCDKLVPNGATGTIAMLHAGSEQACVAKEVQDDLRGLILPKPADLGSDSPTEELEAAIGTVSPTFDTTTLQAVDKSVNKVSCLTNVQLNGIQGDQRRFRITYDVSPSAENPNMVVVSADTNDARAYARDQIGNAIAHQNAAKAQQEEASRADDAHRRLLAQITPKWLVGTWIPTGADARQCGNGQALTFQPDHRINGARLTGRWVLNQDQLHAVGQGTDGGAEINGTITAADTLSFTVTNADNSATSLRRCTRDEIVTDPDLMIDNFSAAGEPK